MAMVDDGVIPVDVRLAETHEYVRVDEDRARIGITPYAAEQLGDVVFVELPDVGQVLEKGDTFGSIESVKAASDLYMPISGEVVAVNQQLVAEPELVNSSPFEDGWMIEVLLSTPNEVEHLMEATAYQRFVAELS